MLTLVILAVSLPTQAQNVVERAFEDDTWTEGLVDLRSLDLTRTQLTAHGYVGGGIQVRIPTDGYRGFGPLDRLDPAPEQAWYRYHVRLLSWNAAYTGKLPGLAGLYSSSARGCIPPTESSPGWSARGLFGPPGTQGVPTGRVPIGTYLYHVDQISTCGDLLWWPGASLEQGRWHCVEGRVRMNTPGSTNGVFQGWLDGQQMILRSDIQYRRAGETNIGVRHKWHNVYFGGSWPTPNPLSLEYDEVLVSTSGRVGCLSPFTDLGDTVHANALTELHALGRLYGCDYRKACPLRELTRGETAALFGRIVGLPSTSTDYFDDDDGNVFEGAINRMAEAGITEGCRTRAFCPSDTITRAQFAVMVVRALNLTGSPADAFSDDRGHWAETAINRLAAAGLTNGCAPDRFCPNNTLTRAEVATFFLRIHRQIKLLGPASVEPPADFPPPGEPPPVPPEEQD
jgi:hypothetical protein